jgi:hypothetical protein
MTGVDIRISLQSTDWLRSNCSRVVRLQLAPKLAPSELTKILKKWSVLAKPFHCKIYVDTRGS